MGPQADGTAEDPPETAPPDPLELVPLTGEEAELLAVSLLRHRHDAIIAAMTPRGHPASLPPGLETYGRKELTGMTVALIPPTEAMEVIDTFTRAVSRGAASCRIHLVGDGGRPATYHVFDLTERHGIMLRIIVPQPGAGRSRPDDDGPSEAMFRPMYCAVVKDEGAVVRGVDSHFTAMFGLEAEDCIGRRSLEFIHPDDHQLAVEAWLSMTQDPGRPRAVRLRHRHADGHWVWVEMVNHNHIGTDRTVRTDLVDITDQMAAQQALAARERLLHGLAEALPLGVLQIETDRRVTYANHLAGELLGREMLVTADDVTDQVLDEDRPALLELLEGALTSGETGECEVRLARPRRQVCSIVVQVVSGEDGGVGTVLVCVSDITERARLQRELHRRATYDPLTGALNRSSTVHALERALDDGRSVGLVFVDLDRFKPVNDRYGHAVGDELLVEVVDRLRDAARTADLVGRFGGDEFLVVADGIASDAEALALVERVADSLEAPIDLSVARLQPLASFGVAWGDRTTVTADELLARADRAMYEAKAALERCPVLWTPAIDDDSEPADTTEVAGTEQAGEMVTSPGVAS